MAHTLLEAPTYILQTEVLGLAWVPPEELAQGEQEEGEAAEGLRVCGRNCSDSRACVCLPAAATRGPACGGPQASIGGPEPAIGCSEPAIGGS